MNDSLYFYGGRKASCYLLSGEACNMPGQTIVLGGVWTDRE
jgi:hypothetical protein